MNHLRAFGRPVSLALVLSLLSAAAPAAAQTDEQRAAARALATEGATAFNEGRFKDAADLFGRAESLVHAPPHLLFLARSYAKLGQFVRARETYIKITKEQIAPNSPQAFRDAQNSAQDELRAVEPKIAKLTIQITNAQDAQNLTVTVDGNPVPPVLIGVPQPVDPGEHRVEAVATGKRARAQMVALRDGERGAVTLQLEPDAGAVATPAPGTGTATTAGATTAASTESAPLGQPAAPPAPLDQGPSSGPNGMRIGSYVAFGVGAVGIGVGTIFLLRGAGKRSEADDAFKACAEASPTGRCPQNSPGAKKTDELDDQATSASTIGVAGLVVGGVGVAAGVTLLVLSSNKSSAAASHTQTAKIVPIVSPNYIGLSGTF
ncbi:MAG: tetratricopeptide repeat protein [Myxococcota bacterium]